MYRTNISAFGPSVAMTATSPAAQAPADSRPIAQSTNRSVRVEGVVAAPVSEVWRVFTTSEGAREFFAQKANIDLELGGLYQIQFDATDERSGTKGLRILSYAPQEMISFQWNAPPDLPAVRDGGTWVVVGLSGAKSWARKEKTIHHMELLSIAG